MFNLNWNARPPSYKMIYKHIKIHDRGIPWGFMGLRGCSWDSVGFRVFFTGGKTKYKIHDRGIPWVFVGFRGFFTRVKNTFF